MPPSPCVFPPPPTPGEALPPVPVSKPLAHSLGQVAPLSRHVYHDVQAEGAEPELLSSSSSFPSFSSPPLELSPWRPACCHAGAFPPPASCPCQPAAAKCLRVGLEETASSAHLSDPDLLKWNASPSRKRRDIDTITTTWREVRKSLKSLRGAAKFSRGRQVVESCFSGGLYQGREAGQHKLCREEGVRVSSVFLQQPPPKKIFFISLPFTKMQSVSPF